MIGTDCFSAMLAARKSSTLYESEWVSKYGLVVLEFRWEAGGESVDGIMADDVDRVFVGPVE